MAPRWHWCTQRNPHQIYFISVRKQRQIFDKTERCKHENNVTVFICYSKESLTCWSLWHWRLLLPCFHWRAASVDVRSGNWNRPVIRKSRHWTDCLECDVAMSTSHTSGSVCKIVESISNCVAKRFYSWNYKKTTISTELLTENTWQQQGHQ